MHPVGNFWLGLKASSIRRVCLFQDLVDVILKKMDIDRDGKLSYNDYKTSVLKNPMLLESLGPVLPPRPFTLGFLTTFTKKYGKLWQYSEHGWCLQNIFSVVHCYIYCFRLSQPFSKQMISVKYFISFILFMKKSKLAIRT